MRKSVRLALTSVVTSMFCVGIPVAAQNQPTPGIRSACVKVQPGKATDFTKWLDAVRPVEQARADAGEFSARFALRSVYPAGLEAACDYLLLSLYPGFPPDPKTTMSPDAVNQKAHVAMSGAEYLAKRDELSRLRRAELWVVRDNMGFPAKGNYIRFNYVKAPPGDMNAWLKLERETFKPVHQARAELGAGISAWAVLTLSMPSGSLTPYNGATLDVFKDWASIASPSKYDEAVKKTGKDQAQAFDESNKWRGGPFVRTELYEVVDVIRPAR